MEKLVLDVHTHTIASGHAYGTVREMAQAASEKGIQLLGLSEHAPGIPGTTSPLYYTCMMAIPRTLYGVELVHGSEVNVCNDGTLSLEERFFKYLDYAIAGIHGICYQDAGREQNTKNLIQCMQHEKIFFVSHPDDDHTPLDYETLVPAARDCHVALEVNNSSFLKGELRLNCRQNYKTMLALCVQYNVPILVSSDAHDPSRVGLFDDAVKLLDEINFPNQLILNTSVEKFRNFIQHK